MGEEDNKLQIHPLDYVICLRKYISGGTSNQILEDLCWRNVLEKFGNEVAEEISKQLEIELNIIKSMDDVAYLYLAHRDFLKSHNIKSWQIAYEAPVEASLVNYLLDISEINPLDKQNHLYHQMFMGVQGNKIPNFVSKFKEVDLISRLMDSTGVSVSLKDVNLNNYQIYLKIMGISLSESVWFGKGESLFKEGKITEQQIISSREDLLEVLLAKEIPFEVAYTITEHVRKGHGLTVDEKELLYRNGFTTEYVDYLTEIKYLCSRTQAINRVNYSLRALYYKANYPKEFYKVFCEMLEHKGTKSSIVKKACEEIEFAEILSSTPKLALDEFMDCLVEYEKYRGMMS